ncbi:MAG: putative 2OG-Fe(II) oxygenase [Pseudomonadales bacterium]
MIERGAENTTGNTAPNSTTVEIGRGAILHTDFWWSMMPSFEVINDQLLQEIRQHKQQHPIAAAGSNKGCWRGHQSYQSWAAIQEFAIWKLKAIHRHYLGLGTSCRSLDDLTDEAFEFEYWTNVNEPGSGNSIHCHAKWHWSGVYYVQGKDTGAIEFFSQPYLNQNVSLGLPFGQSFTVEPSDGLLLIFPSYLLHEVLPNPSDKERVSLAFNVRLNFP